MQPKYILRKTAFMPSLIYIYLGYGQKFTILKKQPVTKIIPRACQEDIFDAG